MIANEFQHILGLFEKKFPDPCSGLGCADSQVVYFMLSRLDNQLRKINCFTHILH